MTTTMTLLLTIVSVIALWTFLTQLVVGLLLVFTTLDAIRGALERIVAGVRAIERETSPLGELADQLPATANDMTTALRPLARRA